MQKWMKSFGLLGFAGLAGVLVAYSLTGEAGAHCDTMDGPVVVAAKAALAKGDPTSVLRWVPKDREDDVKAAFAKAIAARKASPEARDVADTWFFETLVRIHRAGEGEPFTGLRPAGSPAEAGIASADRALASGDVDDLARDLASAVADGVRARFARVVEAQRHADHSVEAGRAHVAAYVEFVHYVERLHGAASGSVAHGAVPGHAGHGEHGAPEGR